MRDPRDSPAPVRRPLEGLPPPDPFYRTPEFVRSAWLLAILSVVGVLGYIYSRSVLDRAMESQPPPAATAPGQPASRAPLSPEEVAARETRLLTLFEGSLRDSRNGTDFEDTSGYRRLLELIAHYRPEDFAVRLTRHLDRAEALRDPGGWRGDFVTYRGLVGEVWPVRLALPVLGHRNVRRALLTDGDGQDGVIVDFLGDLPAELRREALDVQAVFYRTVTYPAQTEDSRGHPHSIERTAPWLIARSWEVVPANTPSRVHGIFRDHTALVLVLTGFAVFTTHLVLLLVRHRRRRYRRPPPQATSIREMFERQLRERGPPPAPPQST